MYVYALDDRICAAPIKCYVMQWGVDLYISVYMRLLHSNVNIVMMGWGYAGWGCLKCPAKNNYVTLEWSITRGWGVSNFLMKSVT